MTGSERRLSVFLSAAAAVAILALTWIGIRQSMADSYRLLVVQGTAFTESLAQAAQNAIASESFYDYFLQQRYADLVTSLTDRSLDSLDEAQLLRFALIHDLESVVILDSSATVVVGATVSGRRVLPQAVADEAIELLSDREIDFSLLADESEEQVETVHYYLQVTNQLDRVVVLASDAQYHDAALAETGIESLARNMARESGVEYIVYQTTEGVIFSSRRQEDVVDISQDPFLQSALEADSIVSRQRQIDERGILELVRPFSSRRYPFGLFRVGLSLDSYYSVSRGLMYQMAILALALVGLFGLIILYVGSRAKRRELSRKYSRIKTVTDRIFDQMHTGVAVVDPDGIVRFCNAAFDSIFSLSGRSNFPWTDVIESGALDHESFMRSSAATDERELAVRVGPGEKTLLIVRAKLEDQTEEATSVAVVAYDISRLKEFEELSVRRERLSEMGNLAAGVAHEIRNPLNSISIAAQRLAREFSPVENAAEFQAFTQTIRAETGRLNDIITRFLALARSEKKNASVVEFGSLVSEVSDLLRLEAEKLGHRFEASIETDLYMRAAPDRLKQVLMNLFNNAKEALGDRSGIIRLEAARVPNGIRIRFSDSGPGIPEELREKVLAPYFTTKDAGTGLGLPMIHRIVSELDGTLKIGTSDLGGAEIEIILVEADVKS